MERKERKIVLLNVSIVERVKLHYILQFDLKVIGRSSKGDARSGNEKVTKIHTRYVVHGYSWTRKRNISVSRRIICSNGYKWAEEIGRFDARR